MPDEPPEAGRTDEGHDTHEAADRGRAAEPRRGRDERDDEECAVQQLHYPHRDAELPLTLVVSPHRLRDAERERGHGDARHQRGRQVVHELCEHARRERRQQGGADARALPEAIEADAAAPHDLVEAQGSRISRHRDDTDHQGNERVFRRRELAREYQTGDTEADATQPHRGGVAQRCCAIQRPQHQEAVCRTGAAPACVGAASGVTGAARASAGAPPRRSRRSQMARLRSVQKR